MAVDSSSYQMISTPPGARLEDVTEMMRTLSQYSDPDEVAREYIKRIKQFYPIDRAILLARPDMDSDEVRYAEVGNWDRPALPWGNLDDWEVLGEGLLQKLCINAEATILHELNGEVTPAEEALLEGMHSLRAIPLFRKGEASQMIIGLKEEPSHFREEDLATLVWLGNLFGRAMENLVVSRELRAANEAVDRELKAVGQIQRDLLPEQVPEIHNLELATYYKTSQRAGGDYYDFFPLEDGRWGILIADVSGHGTPAAVVMAIIHTIAHTYNGPQDKPSQFLTYINKHLCQRFTSKSGIFVTAFYGIFDPHYRRFTYSSAGHNPPQKRRCGRSEVYALDKAGRIPLGISDDITYDDAEEQLGPGDRVVLYTDGIIEAYDAEGKEQFGTDRLVEIVGRCDLNTTTIVDAIIQQLHDYTGTTNQTDDCTLVVMKVR